MLPWFRLLLPVLVLGCVDLGRPQGVVVLDAHAPVTDRPSDARDGSGAGAGGAPGGAGGESGSGGGPGGVDADGGLPPPPDLAEPDAPLASNGAACTMAAACSSGFCVDGICCNSACTGTCQACDVASAAGTCTPIADGQDPASECEQQPVASCGTDGVCNGSGACRKYAAGTQCAPGRCTGATEYAASTCSAAGACTPGNMRSCAPNMCMGDSCASTCTSPGDCQSGFFCDGGTCRSKRANGTACTMALQCASNTCVDGVCCATACNQSCQACNLSGSVGTCTPIANGMDPGGECPAQAASTCGRAGGCDGRGACRFHPGGTSCGAASCSGSTETAASTCNGAGSCTAGTTRTCPGTLCSGTTCATSCTSAAQCQANHKCVRSACAPLKIAGLVVHDTALAANWAIERNFQVGTGGAHPWTDYPASYVVSLDAGANFFLGNEWIRVDAQSKKYNGGPQATITLNGTADVYLLVDDRWAMSPVGLGWLSGWTDTGLEMRVFENSTRPNLPFSVYRKTGQSGSVTTPAINNSFAFNYFIVVD